MDLITHTDLDGVSCSLVRVFDNVHFVNYGEVTEVVFELLKDDRPFFMTDYRNFTIAHLKSLVQEITTLQKK